MDVEMPGRHFAIDRLSGSAEAGAIAYSNDFHMLALATFAVLPLVLLVRAR